VKTSNKKAATPVTASKAKAAPAKKALPTKKAVPTKKAIPAKKAVVVKKPAPVKKPTSVKKPAPVKSAAPASSKSVTPVKVKAKTAAAPVKTLKTAKAAATAKAAPAKTSNKAAAPAAPKARVVSPKPIPAPKVKATPKPAAPKMISVPEAKPMTVKKVATPTPEVAQAAAPAAVPVVASAPDQLIRATRPSARLAQITVPSLPPAVASTAAKASFMPSAPVATVSAPFAPIKKDPKLANNWKSKQVEALSDAEILAMPDAEYMNSVQLAYFRRKLAILKQDILNSAGATTEHLREDTVVVPDPADRATIEEEHALELRTRDRERKLLKKIEQSIVLIDGGEYGYCDETGEPIGVGRLLARPTATLSLEAQQRRELKQKMFGD
jgi:DnaK suppressor protein